jgi:2-keto-4-pentenoate hydratase/2-oxohepta-3-ene-1,7-dioic acid hydratase in catechol pathway
MKLASFDVATATGTDRRIGVYSEATDELIDVAATYARALDAAGEGSPREVAAAHAPPSDMCAFLGRGDRAMDAARRALEHAEETNAETGLDGATLRYDPGEVTLLSPVPRPNSIRDYMVMAEHVENVFDEIPEEWYDIPVYYKGDADCIGHPGQEIEWPSYTEKMDYELELAAVLGKRGRDIDAAAAEEYIAGYTIYNDLSARDVQFEEMAVNLGPSKGKDFDGSNVFGPYLVTPDEIELEEVQLTARINGEEWSSGTLGAMQHSFAEIIEHTSQSQHLHPGDVLGSGTVGMGCGLEMDRYLERGDTVELAAEGIGTLSNRLVDR